MVSIKTTTVIKTTNIISSKSTEITNLGALIGGIVGGVILLLIATLIIFILFYFLCRSKRNNFLKSEPKSRNIYSPTPNHLPHVDSSLISPIFSNLSNEKGENSIATITNDNFCLNGISSERIVNSSHFQLNYVSLEIMKDSSNPKSQSKEAVLNQSNDLYATLTEKTLKA